MVEKNLTETGTFEEFEGIECLSLDHADQASGGMGPLLPLMGIAWKSLALFLKYAERNGWFVEVENANGPGSTIYNVTDGAGNQGTVNGGGFGSDIRLKQDIHCEGAIDTLGVKVYSWEYKDYPGERFVGLMAQDLLARPDLAHAVFTFNEGPFAGFYGVNYGALGMTMLPEEAWDGDVCSLMLNQSVSA